MDTVNHSGEEEKGLILLNQDLNLQGFLQVGSRREAIMMTLAAQPESTLQGTERLPQPLISLTQETIIAVHLVIPKRGKPTLLKYFCK